ncbi:MULTISPECIES: DUF302 domain-containing protein [unclassified Neisseria]|uniref:DUF302 domain-containing protein n=1 Tax=unclassified Neisseria TaxID=2623750 RepID=UPI0010718FDB|nr:MULTISPECIES: DUF302 domain-containing protein [unclassified Neisseria]MBF0804177.1 DUF302 domain-containing protein [Neisseria sp. 19428wB4_WF04]TFU43077.1 DUF302 domain-containing protein [Neisseria sp. WF04]
MKLLKTLPLLCIASLAAACAHTPPKPERTAKPTHTVASRYGFNETVQRIEAAVKAKGMTVFGVIDHQEAARQHGLTMQPAKVIIFGNPKAGTPLMVKDPEFALRLPLRVLVTENGGSISVVFQDTRALIENSRLDFSDVENGLAKAETLLQKTVAE